MEPLSSNSALHVSPSEVPLAKTSSSTSNATSAEVVQKPNVLAKRVVRKITPLDPKKLQQAGLDRKIAEALSKQKSRLNSKLDLKLIPNVQSPTSPNVSSTGLTSFPVSKSATTSLNMQEPSPAKNPIITKKVTPPRITITGPEAHTVLNTQNLEDLDPHERLVHVKHLLNKKLLQKKRTEMNDNMNNKQSLQHLQPPSSTYVSVKNNLTTRSPPAQPPSSSYNSPQYKLPTKTPEVKAKPIIFSVLKEPAEVEKAAKIEETPQKSPQDIARKLQFQTDAERKVGEEPAKQKNFKCLNKNFKEIPKASIKAGKSQQQQHKNVKQQSTDEREEVLPSKHTYSTVNVSQNPKSLQAEYLKQHQKKYGSNEIPKAKIKTGQQHQQEPLGYKPVKQSEQKLDFPDVSPLKSPFPMVNVPKETPLPAIDSFKKPYNTTNSGCYVLQQQFITPTATVWPNYEINQQATASSTLVKSNLNFDAAAAGTNSTVANSLIVLENKVLTQDEMIDLTELRLSTTTPRFINPHKPIPEVVIKEENTEEYPATDFTTPVDRAEKISQAEVTKEIPTTDNEISTAKVVISNKQNKKIIINAQKLKLPPEQLADLARKIKQKTSNAKNAATKELNEINNKVPNIAVFTTKDATTTTASATTTTATATATSSRKTPTNLANCVVPPHNPDVTAKYPKELPVKLFIQNNQIYVHVNKRDEPKLSSYTSCDNNETPKKNLLENSQTTNNFEMTESCTHLRDQINKSAVEIIDEPVDTENCFSAVDFIAALSNTNEINEETSLELSPEELNLSASCTMNLSPLHIQSYASNKKIATAKPTQTTSTTSLKSNSNDNLSSNQQMGTIVIESSNGPQTILTKESSHKFDDDDDDDGNKLQIEKISKNFLNPDCSLRKWPELKLVNKPHTDCQDTKTLIAASTEKFCDPKMFDNMEVKDMEIDDMQPLVITKAHAKKLKIIPSKKSTNSNSSTSIEMKKAKEGKTIDPNEMNDTHQVNLKTSNVQSNKNIKNILKQTTNATTEDFAKTIKPDENTNLETETNKMRGENNLEDCNISLKQNIQTDSYNICNTLQKPLKANADPKDLTQNETTTKSSLKLSCPEKVDQKSESVTTKRISRFKKGKINLVQRNKMGSLSNNDKGSDEYKVAGTTKANTEEEHKNELNEKMSKKSNRKSLIKTEPEATNQSGQISGQNDDNMMNETITITTNSAKEIQDLQKTNQTLSVSKIRKRPVTDEAEILPLENETLSKNTEPVAKEKFSSKILGSDVAKASTKIDNHSKQDLNSTKTNLTKASVGIGNISQQHSNAMEAGLNKSLDIDIKDMPKSSTTADTNSQQRSKSQEKSLAKPLDKDIISLSKASVKNSQIPQQHLNITEKNLTESLASNTLDLSEATTNQDNDSLQSINTTLKSLSKSSKMEIGETTIGISNSSQNHFKTVDKALIRTTNISQEFPQAAIEMSNSNEQLLNSPSSQQHSKTPEKSGTQILESEEVMDTPKPSTIKGNKTPQHINSVERNANSLYASKASEKMDKSLQRHLGSPERRKRESLNTVIVDVPKAAVNSLERSFTESVNNADKPEASFKVDSAQLHSNMPPKSLTNSLNTDNMAPIKTTDSITQHFSSSTNIRTQQNKHNEQKRESSEMAVTNVEQVEQGKAQKRMSEKSSPETQSQKAPQRTQQNNRNEQIRESFEMAVTNVGQGEQGEPQEGISEKSSRETQSQKAPQRTQQNKRNEQIRESSEMAVTNVIVEQGEISEKSSGETQLQKTPQITQQNKRNEQIRESSEMEKSSGETQLQKTPQITQQNKRNEQIRESSGETQLQKTPQITQQNKRNEQIRESSEMTVTIVIVKQGEISEKSSAETQLQNTPQRTQQNKRNEQKRESSEMAVTNVIVEQGETSEKSSGETQLQKTPQRTQQNICNELKIESSEMAVTNIEQVEQGEPQERISKKSSRESQSQKTPQKTQQNKRNEQKRESSEMAVTNVEQGEPQEIISKKSSRESQSQKTPQRTQQNKRNEQIRESSEMVVTNVIVEQGETSEKSFRESQSQKTPQRTQQNQRNEQKIQSSEMAVTNVEQEEAQEKMSEKVSRETQSQKIPHTFSEYEELPDNIGITTSCKNIAAQKDHGKILTSPIQQPEDENFEQDCGKKILNKQETKAETTQKRELSPIKSQESNFGIASQKLCNDTNEASGELATPKKLLNQLDSNNKEKDKLENQQEQSKQPVEKESLEKGDEQTVFARQRSCRTGSKGRKSQTETTAATGSSSTTHSTRPLILDEDLEFLPGNVKVNFKLAKTKQNETMQPTTPLTTATTTAHKRQRLYSKPLELELTTPTPKPCKRTRYYSQSLETFDAKSFENVKSVERTESCQDKTQESNTTTTTKQLKTIEVKKESQELHNNNCTDSEDENYDYDCSMKDCEESNEFLGFEEISESSSFKKVADDAKEIECEITYGGGTLKNWLTTGKAISPTFDKAESTKQLQNQDELPASSSAICDAFKKRWDLYSKLNEDTDIADDTSPVDDEEEINEHLSTKKYLKRGTTNVIDSNKNLLEDKKTILNDSFQHSFIRPKTDADCREKKVRKSPKSQLKRKSSKESLFKTKAEEVSLPFKGKEDKGMKCGKIVDCQQQQASSSLKCQVNQEKSDTESNSPDASGSKRLKSKDKTKKQNATSKSTKKHSKNTDTDSSCNDRIEAEKLNTVPVLGTENITKMKEENKMDVMGSTTKNSDRERRKTTKRLEAKDAKEEKNKDSDISVKIPNSDVDCSNSRKSSPTNFKIQKADIPQQQTVKVSENSIIKNSSKPEINKKENPMIQTEKAEAEYCTTPQNLAIKRKRGRPKKNLIQTTLAPSDQTNKIETQQKDLKTTIISETSADESPLPSAKKPRLQAASIKKIKNEDTDSELASYKTQEMASVVDDLEPIATPRLGLLKQETPLKLTVGRKRKSFNEANFNPRLLLITNREQLDTDEVITETEPGTGAIQCGLCLKRTQPAKWISHLAKHYGVGWQVGEEQLNFENRSVVLSCILNYMKCTNCTGLCCRMCNKMYRSGLGMLMHIESCGAQAIRLQCEFCNKDFAKSSFPIHMRSCSAKTALEDPSSDENVDEDNEKKEKIFGNSGRLKRHSTIKAENKLKMLGEELEKMSDNVTTEKTEFDPKTRIRYVPPLKGDFTAKWSEDIEKLGKASCPATRCKFTSTDVKELNEHLKNCKHLKSGYFCNYCSLRVFASEKEAIEHVLKEHRHGKGRKKSDNDSDVSLKIDTEESSDDTDLSEGVNESDIENESVTDPEDDLDDDCDNKKGNKRQKAKKTCNKNLNKSTVQTNRKLVFEARCFNINKKVITKWKSFLKLNHSCQSLYTEFKTQYSIINNRDFDKYLPTQTVSMKFNLTTKHSLNHTIGDHKENVEWSELKRFESVQNEMNTFLFLGAPIKLCYWLPLPAHVNEQYLAVVYRQEMFKFIKFSQPKQHHTIIVIFKVIQNNRIPELNVHYGFLINDGPVHHLSFVPSGGYDESSNRLGLVAIATVTSTIKVYSLPLNVDLESIRQNSSSDQSVTLIEVKPSFLLNLDILYNKEEQQQQQQHVLLNPQCMQICWSEYFGHQHIFASFSNGFLGIWDITNDPHQNLNRFEVEGVLNYVPLNYFYAGEKCVKCFAVHYDTCGPRWLAVSGAYRKLVIYDIKNFSQPIIMKEDIHKNILTSMDWCPLWETVLCSYSDDLVNNGRCVLVINPANVMFSHVKLDYMGCGVTQIHYTPVTNMCVAAMNNGDISFLDTKELHYDCPLSKQCRGRRMLYSLDVKQLNGQPIVKLPKANQKTDTDTSHTDWVMHDSNYKEKYGLIFQPLIKLKESYNKIYISEDRCPPLNIIPLMRINTLRCNLNFNSKNLVALGYENGFLRLIYFDKTKHFFN